MITEGSKNNPVRLNNHLFGPILKEVHWNVVGPVGILTLEAPNISQFNFDAGIDIGGIGAYADGATIPVEDYKTLTAQAIQIGFTDSNVLGILFEAHYDLWQIEAIVPLPGSAPDKPPGAISNYNGYVAGTWPPPHGFGSYGATKAVYESAGPGFSWIETGSMLALPDPHGAGGVLPGTWGFEPHSLWTGHWADTLDASGHPLYGAFTRLGHYTSAYPSTATFTYGDPDVPGYLASQQWDPWLERQEVGYGLGTHKVHVDKIINNVRSVWLILFRNVTAESGVIEIDMGQTLDVTDSDLPSADATFTLRVYNGGSFVVGLGGSLTNSDGTLLYEGSRTFAYDVVDDPVIRINVTGFL